MVWLVRLEPLESVVPRELLVPMEFQERRELKETLELLVHPDSQELEVFKEKWEMLDQWDPRVLRWVSFLNSKKSFLIRILFFLSCYLR